MLKEFKPTSLCNTMYKIVTIILINRMKDYVALLVLEEQGAFILGRCINDNILIVQEAIQSLKIASKRNSLMVI